MNFSAFGGFSGIHQFAAKFGHDAQSGAFSTAVSVPNMSQDVHGNRYHTTPSTSTIAVAASTNHSNHFNQNTATISNSNMQYGQNISLPYTTHAQPPQNDHQNMFQNDPKNNLIKTKMERDRDEVVINQQILQNVNQSWQTLANPANNVDYPHLLSASLPISIQHFLKYSDAIKKENVVGTTNGGSNGGGTVIGHLNNGNNVSVITNGHNGTLLSNGGNVMVVGGNGLNNGQVGVGGGVNIVVTGGGGGTNGGNVNVVGVNGVIGQNVGGQMQVQSNGMLNAGNTVQNHVMDQSNIVETGKKKKKRTPKIKVIKEKKPRPKPGEIRETKALDGSTLYCCPECQMAYPDRGLIEQHVISHAVERRFVCDICNAALKRKDHLTRHKLSHCPDRPHVCQICMKSFKRKEQLTLHIVIHSGEKKHVCQECGKGFYRKDHLRKHTRSHIARRVKTEVSEQSVAINAQLQQQQQQQQQQQDLQDLQQQQNGMVVGGSSNVLHGS